MYVLKQPNCKDMISSMLGLSKPRKDSGSTPVHYPALEETLVSLFVRTMKESSSLIWSSLASELIFFILFQYITFQSFVEKLHQELTSNNEERYPDLARDELMWALLQYISGSISKNPTADFVPVMKLFSIYDEKTPLPVPDLKDQTCYKKLAAVTIFITLRHKAENDGIEFSYRLPAALQFHYNFLTGLSPAMFSDLPESLKKGFAVSIYCNAFSTSTDLFQKVMMALCKHMGASPELSASIPIPGSSLLGQTPTEPIPMEVLDSLSVHSKMSLIHHIMTFINKYVSTKNNFALSPALVENYCRLIVYPEIESLGIKGFLNNLLPLIFKNSAWGVLHMLMEIFSFRLHQVQAIYRMSLLGTLQVNLIGGSVAAVNKNNQLHLCLESTTLRLITGT